MLKGVFMRVKEGSGIIDIENGYKMQNFIIEGLGQGKGIIFTPKLSAQIPYLLLIPTKKDVESHQVNPKFHDFYLKNRSTSSDEVEVKYYAHFEQIEYCDSDINIDLLDKYSLWDKEQVRNYVSSGNMYLWVLRVFKLNESFILPVKQAQNYTKLINYGDAMPDKLFEGEPVLSDDEFKEIYYNLCDDFGFEKKIKFDGKTSSEYNTVGSEQKDNELIYVEPEQIDQATPKLKIPFSVYRNIANSIDSGKHIILEGVPGTGKTVIANALCDLCVEKGYVNGYTQATATSDWSTYDTIGGLMPDKDGNLYFSEGIVLKSIRENNLLIIDEINRADIDKAFGPLFTVLSNQTVELNYKIFKDENDKVGKNIKIVPDLDHQRSHFDPEDATYYVGNNWRIIGTMNTYDKDSLYDLSYAFMRRFFFCNVDVPDENAYVEIIDSFNELDGEYKSSLKKLIKLNDEEYSRKIGPAVIIDLIKYLITCQKYSSEDNFAMEEAVIGYIIPQFEGLPQDSLNDIKNFLTNEVKLDKNMIHNKFKDIQETF